MWSRVVVPAPGLMDRTPPNVYVKTLIPRMAALGDGASKAVIKVG